ncbi:MAG: endonuclease domain-containing protein [Candidatus Gastranaerophilales bacterium]|nr:endonuclease domain-containing protein [Candidatus Gastranaerophilales bacterium]
MPHKQIKSEIKELARNMRSEPTKEEHILWQRVLRKRQLGYIFRRQFVIDNKYIADFICLEKRLIIEIDGGQHCNNENDKIRDKYLKEQNFRVLRFWNNEILNNLEGVYTKIQYELEIPSPEIRDFDPSAREGLDKR